MRLWHIGVAVAVVILGLGLIQAGDLMSPTTALAQDGEGDQCEQLIASAISSARQACEGLSRGALCLGSDDLSVLASRGETLVLTAGDTTELNDVNAIESMPADPSADQWGVALLNLPTRAPDTSSGVMAVLFGEAQLARSEQNEAERPTLPVYNRGAAAVNLRNGAGITYNLVGQLAAGEEVIADGRNEQGDWLRVRLVDGIAWVFTPLVNWEGDLSTLEVLLPNDVSPVFHAEEPFQSFTLTTASSSSCAAVSSGLLLQHTGTESASIQINQVTLEFAGATLLVNAIPGNSLDVKVLSGAGSVTARGIAQEAGVGSGVRVNLGGTDGLTPVALPAVLQTYTFSDIAYAPVDLLPQPITCMVGLPAGSVTARLRVGPGTNRGVIGSLSANASYPVLGWADAPDGEAWWELDTGEQTSWVAQSDVRAIGACSRVAQVEPPPLVFAPAPPAPVDEGDGAVESDLAPEANSVWQMVPGSDNMSGECSGAPAINFCDHLAAIAPAGGGISWKGMEPSPYYLSQIRPNVYAYAGPNVNGTGTVNMTLSFTSETTLKMTMSLVLSSEPGCQHVYYYSGTRNW